MLKGGKRDLNSVRTLSDRQNLHNYQERKAEPAVRGENADYLKLKPTWNLERWEQKKSSEIELYETRRELESPRLELHSAKQQADQAQREKKISSCGEMKMRNRLFKLDSSEKVAQELAKTLRKYEESVGKNQIVPDT